MNNRKIENLVGALALAISDDLLQAAQQHVRASAPAAAVGHIGHAPGLTIDQLSRALGLSHPGTVRLVDRLEKEGLLIRKKSTVDGRAVALSLSASGLDLYQEILSSRRYAIHQAIASLDSSERQILGRIAHKILGSLISSEGEAYRVCRLCNSSVCTDCPVEAKVMAQQSGGQAAL
jgi:MarR family transcriptional regulator, negative regulator of the multidrug operon emrRAB